MATHRISVDIDEEEHKYLKMCCVKMGVSIKQFVLKAVIERVDAQEDQWWLEKPETKELLNSPKEENFVFIDHEGKVHALPS